MDKNSLLYWWPLIKDLAIPVPKTAIAYPCNDIDKLALAVHKMGWPNAPLFLRTDLCSGKHDWKDSCFLDPKIIKTDLDLQAHIDKVLESNVKWEMLGIYPQALVVREFLDLETAFFAFAGNMPINKERRYFIENSKVLCSHPYWPITAFNRHPARMAEQGYESKLEAISKLDGSEGIITDYIKRLCRLEGSWSVDFAKGKNGVWYLIDMATAYNSYHMPHEER